MSQIFELARETFDVADQPPPTSEASASLSASSTSQGGASCSRSGGTASNARSPRDSDESITLTSIEAHIDWSGGVWLHLLDDAEGVGLPMFEVALESSEAKLDVAMMLHDGTGEVFPKTTATLAVKLHALSFNSANSRWEPVLESCSARLRLVQAMGGAIELHVTAIDPIELNASHALLHEALKALPRLERLTLERQAATMERGADAGLTVLGAAGADDEQVPEAAEDRESAEDSALSPRSNRTSAESPHTPKVSAKDALFHKSAEAGFGFLSRVRPCAACNETELALTVLSRPGPQRSRKVKRTQDLVAQPMGGVVAWAGSVADDLSSLQYAKTTSSQLLVDAVRMGDTPLSRALLQRGLMSTPSTLRVGRAPRRGVLPTRGVGDAAPRHARGV